MANHVIHTRAIPALCIAGTHSGCGKTTVALGLMSALVKRGLTVQAYKVGPDFIDPGHHRRITGRDSHNLDGWMLSRPSNLHIFHRYVKGADVAVVEGVMGIFDGFSGADETGSTAQMAKWLDLPVLLVIDARSMARSAAALALGFSEFDKKLPLAGVIFNRVGGQVHEEMIREAMAGLKNITVYGCLPRDDNLSIPSRHLGLVTDEEFGIQAGDHMERLSRWIEGHLDVGDILENLRIEIPECESRPEGVDRRIRIAVARDEAFCFYYPENLRLLREAGAELVGFSPLRSKALPEDIKGMILGGGYPELHCRALAENKPLLEEIRTFGLQGRPVYAECGGFMYLMMAIHDLEGRSYDMAGLFPIESKMTPGLKALGYREVAILKDSVLGPEGTRVRGHEFHYSMIVPSGHLPQTIYDVTDRKDAHKGSEGFLHERVLGSYIHLHWGSNPEVARYFVEYCKRFG